LTCPPLVLDILNIVGAERGAERAENRDGEEWSGERALQKNDGAERGGRGAGVGDTEIRWSAERLFRRSRYALMLFPTSKLWSNFRYETAVPHFNALDSQPISP